VKAAAAHRADVQRAHRAAVAKAAARARAKAADKARARSHQAKKAKPAPHQTKKAEPAKKHKANPAKKHLVKKKQVTKKHVTKKHVAKKRKAPKKSRAPRASGAHHGFIYPVRGPITSPYGRRFHPILHRWKLHDGTDFGASCGTPIRAAYAGRVAERFHSNAYGNRLMIDHGVVGGRYVTTGYNHAQRYKVHVGQHVRRGQVVGYVGATGYATGCHLHLMVWLGGKRVNPMSWY
jgi:murein DD-endopeptidase MepM/ murein hydrolase activator NlpD